MKKIISILAVAAMLVTSVASLSACGNSESTNNKEFRIGLECGYAPFNWTQISDKNGGVPIQGSKEYAGGYDVEIAKIVADGLGKKLVIVKTEWDGLGPAVNSNKIDAIMAGMSPTAERKKTIDFTDKYYTSNLVIVVKKGGAYENAKSIADFKGAKITAQLNTFHETVVDQIEGVKKQTPMSDFATMRVALESGMIDGYVSEKPEGLSASAANKNFAMVEFADGNGFTATKEDLMISAGIKKGNTELTDKINKILSGISEEKRKEIMDTAIKNQPAAQ